MNSQELKVIFSLLIRPTPENEPFYIGSKRKGKNAYHKDECKPYKLTFQRKKHNESKSYM
jgi:hypothetical protein